MNATIAILGRANSKCETRSQQWHRDPTQAGSTKKFQQKNNIRGSTKPLSLAQKCLAFKGKKIEIFPISFLVKQTTIDNIVEGRQFSNKIVALT